MHKLALASLAFGLFSLAGCGSLYDATYGTDNKVEVSFERNIFLESGDSEADKTVKIIFQDTTGEDFSQFKSKIRSEVTARGYTITNKNPFFVINVSLKDFNEGDSASFERVMGEGFGGGLIGAGLGYAVSDSTGGNGIAGALLGGAAGALVGYAATSLVGEREYYYLISDVRVKHLAEDRRLRKTVRTCNPYKRKVNGITMTGHNCSEKEVPIEHTSVPTYDKQSSRLGVSMQSATIDEKLAKSVLGDKLANVIAGLLPSDI